MWSKELVRNKIYASVLMGAGALTIPIDNDVTGFVFCLLVGIPLFFAGRNWVE